MGTRHGGKQTGGQDSTGQTKKRFYKKINGASLLIFFGGGALSRVALDRKGGVCRKGLRVKRTYTFGAPA